MQHKMTRWQEERLSKIILDKGEFGFNEQNILTMGIDGESVLDFVELTFEVDEVFSYGELKKWAEANGYKKADE